MEILRLVFAAIFLIAGVVCMAAAVFGMFRFHYILNRMHMAATTDTFGLFLSMVGLVIWKGFGPEACKLAIIILFFWVSGPVSSHLIARMEVDTNEKLDEECEVKKYGEL